MSCQKWSLVLPQFSTQSTSILLLWSEDFLMLSVEAYFTMWITTEKLLTIKEKVKPIPQWWKFLLPRVVSTLYQGLTPRPFSVWGGLFPSCPELCLHCTKDWPPDHSLCRVGYFQSCVYTEQGLTPRPFSVHTCMGCCCPILAVFMLCTYKIYRIC